MLMSMPLEWAVAPSASDRNVRIREQNMVRVVVVKSREKPVAGVQEQRERSRRAEEPWDANPESVTCWVARARPKTPSQPQLSRRGKRSPSQDGRRVGEGRR